MRYIGPWSHNGVMGVGMWEMIQLGQYYATLCLCSGLQKLLSFFHIQDLIIFCLIIKINGV